MMLSQRLITAIEKHAAAAYPHECCGLIIRATRQRRYIPCSNSHENPSEHFMISAQAWADAEDMGEVLAIVHSHPDAGPHASSDDLKSCHDSGLPRVIMSWPR